MMHVTLPATPLSVTTTILNALNALLGASGATSTTGPAKSSALSVNALMMGLIAPVALTANSTWSLIGFVTRAVTVLTVGLII